MKTSFKILFFSVFSALLIMGCSRKKDKFISRNFHAITAEFNALYNGSIALEKGRKVLIDNYKDNYFEILPVERMTVNKDFFSPGKTKNENFEIAEVKAIKAIQKHSMNIGGKEKNPQIDEAYLLLGKARYFDQRFVPALEAFNYILHKYPTSDKINQAKVWKEKTNIRLENEALAIKNLKRFLKHVKIKGQDLADATSILAQAYLNIKAPDSAITQLKIAAKATKRKDERGRYHFILAQLYGSIGQKDSANYALDEVIALNRGIPRVYLISAYIEKIKNFDYENGNKEEQLKLLGKMENYRENRSFLDRIYHQIGNYHLEYKSDSSAIAYYNKSLRTKTQNKNIKARNYKTLAEMKFDNNEYTLAGKYYDSTMNNIENQRSKPFRALKRKRENLEDVIIYENIAKTHDSILHLVDLSKYERWAYFTKITDSLKIADAKERERIENAERNKALGSGSSGNARVGLPGANSQSTFYFYNPTTVAYGKSEFKRIWGDRRLISRWRWSSLYQTNIEESPKNPVLAIASKQELFDPQYYIDLIPSEKKTIDNLIKDRNFAYYKLGIIYKEQFKEYGLAKNKLTELLKSNPEERLILPSKYYLYKIHLLLNETEEALALKNDIITNYPDSRYAAILINPESASKKDENSAESLYEELYTLFEAQKFENVISEADKHINAFQGEPMVPKFELLKATAIGRLDGFEAYKEAVSYVGLNYSSSDEGKKALKMEEEVLEKLKTKKFIADSTSTNFKLIYIFKKTEEKKIDKMVKLLNEVSANAPYLNLSTSVDIYDRSTIFVTLHGIKHLYTAKRFPLVLNKKDIKKVKEPDFIISYDNYKIVQIHKNLEDYFNRNKKKPIKKNVKKEKSVQNTESIMLPGMNDNSSKK